MPTFKVTVAYDGTDYVGWQRQANGVSIQGLIEEALRDLDGRSVVVHGAGRTDAGVHALGQVASFTLERALPANTVVRALNAKLPAAIRILSAGEVAPSFNPRFEARAKTYRYRIWNGDVVSPFERQYAWHVVGELDIAAMREAARLVEGEHDFSAFQAAGAEVATTRREVLRSSVFVVEGADGGGLASVHAGLAPGDAGSAGCGSMITYEITGTGFLRYMVRAIVGSLVEVARGRQPAEWITRAIASRDRAAAGPTAPAAGLFLVRVDYG